MQIAGSRWRSTILAIAATAVVFAFAINWSSGGLPEDQDPAYRLDAYSHIIHFSPSTLPQLRLGHYALWQTNPAGEYTLIKRFNVIDSQPISLNGEEFKSWRTYLNSDVAELALTIEPEGDRNTMPSEILIAKVQSNTPEVKLTSSLNLFEATGSALLATPTDGNTSINETSGVWFGAQDANSSTLQLPALASNWQWRAVVVYNDQILEIGDFYTAEGSDNFSNYSALIAAGYNYPGEDFLKNLPGNLAGPLNLKNPNHTVIIGVKPVVGDIPYAGNEIFIPVLSAGISADENNSVQLSNVFTELDLLLTIEAI